MRAESSYPRCLGVALLVQTVCALPAAAIPWDTFVDAGSDSICDVINAANAELVVLSATGELVLITGQDAILAGTEVTLDGLVLVDGDAFGQIEFAVDGDGFRTLWWTALNGTVVAVDEFTGDPSATNSVPADYREVPCDACDLWDDPNACLCDFDSDCDDNNECTVDVCTASGECAFVRVLCQDDDACSFDTCDPVLGCVFLDVVCDDEDSCTFDTCDPLTGCLFVEEDCEDGNLCTDDFCEDGLCVSVDNDLACNDGDACTRFDRCSGGVCRGTPTSGCGDPPRPSVPVIVFCGANASLAMWLTWCGLLGTAAWRRFRQPRRP